MTSFFVPGVPVPKGSARAFINKYTGRAAVIQSNAAKQKPWASLISLKADENGCVPTAEGVNLTIVFLMPRPKSHFRTNGELKPRAVDAPHTKRPDLDKLIRCVKDSLSGVAYQDDCQVNLIKAYKRYLNPGEQAGCKIEVSMDQT
jgi:crossover junction endodeoxyribonuclease RusA